MTAPLSDKERMRAFAQGLIDEADYVVDQCGVVGHLEVARAEAARKLIDQLDTLPAITAYARIPPLVLQSLLDYRQHGVRPGHFLAAVLAGDLFTAMARADEPSMLAMPAIVAWINAELPSDAWGGCGNVDAWCRRARS